ncbi:Nucleotide-binding universal stress protein, UspA family [Caballeronia arationis]|jgi:nucleotide-binding universal stress UspA family protein|uniref:Nucleotide-binding universal stress protein, UspA family n=1 Tax=Caballeronia arationis TaxID=1777142 RepID=A0A7Z7IDG4_9BURK|nr:universal stress protein [Caballeronia arationis]SOE88625.1 Nucleotide-binding universal stress protein, UspA family [Caballeronia arationis]
MRCIVVAYNGSECALGAALFAKDMAQQRGARLHILTVARVPSVGFDACMNEIMEQRIAHWEEALRALKARLPDTQDTIRLSLRTGDPWREIVDYAAEHCAGEIVVGCRRYWLGRWPASHVVRRVVAHARCAVTVVPKPGRALPVTCGHAIA